MSASSQQSDLLSDSKELIMSYAIDNDKDTHIINNDDENLKFRRKFTAMAVGNMMEWYDFAVYGNLADIIGEELFPDDESNKQLLRSLGT